MSSAAKGAPNRHELLRKTRALVAQEIYLSIMTVLQAFGSCHSNASVSRTGGCVACLAGHQHASTVSAAASKTQMPTAVGTTTVGTSTCNPCSPTRYAARAVSGRERTPARTTLTVATDTPSSKTTRRTAPRLGPQRPHNANFPGPLEHVQAHARRQPEPADQERHDSDNTQKDEQESKSDRPSSCAASQRSSESSETSQR